MSEQAHRHCLNIAEHTSASLHEVLLALGPQQLHSRNTQPLVEVMCRSVAGQQLSVKAAGTIWTRVTELCSEQALPDALHAADPEALRGCGLSAAKTKAIKGIVSAAAQGELDEMALKTMLAEARSKHLQKLWGVGQWTADMINMFYFQEADIWPAQDVTASKTLITLSGPGENKDSTELAEPFAPYRSFLAMYMYTYADAAPTT